MKKNLLELRRVCLPEKITGRIFLHSMPGRYEKWEEFLAAARKLNISHVLCLAPLDEVRLKSPEYAIAISNGSIIFDLIECPVPDFDLPQNNDEFMAHMKNVADLIQEGKNLLIHCAGGHGRTGMAAACILQLLGFKPDEALQTISMAGSAPDNLEQQKIVYEFAKLI